MISKSSSPVKVPVRWTEQVYPQLSKVGQILFSVSPVRKLGLWGVSKVRKAISDRHSFLFILILPIVQVDTLCKLILVTKLTRIKWDHMFKFFCNGSNIVNKNLPTPPWSWHGTSGNSGSKNHIVWIQIWEVSCYLQVAINESWPLCFPGCSHQI